MQAAVTPGCAWRTAAGGAASYVADNGARLLPRHLRAILPRAKARGITQDLVVSLGASALALLACTEVVQARLDAIDHMHVGACAQCVRGQQRSDGLFLHDDDRRTSPPLDRPALSNASEATRALAHAYPPTRHPADRGAAVQGLQHCVGPAWRLCGDRDACGEAHGTCQGMAALGPYAPNPQALDCCLRRQIYNCALPQRAWGVSWASGYA